MDINLGNKKAENFEVAAWEVIAAMKHWIVIRRKVAKQPRNR